MNKFFYFILASSIMVYSCKSPQPSSEEAIVSEETIINEADETHEETQEMLAQLNEDGFYGETFDLVNAINLSEALAQIADKDSIQVKVAGSITEVCQKKGCWMKMSDGEESVFIKFKDYGFFMPMDCAGQSAVINGVMKREVQSVEEQKHYLTDAKAPQEEIDAVTEAKTKLTFLASGVKLQ